MASSRRVSSAQASASRSAARPANSCITGATRRSIHASPKSTDAVFSAATPWRGGSRVPRQVPTGSRTRRHRAWPSITARSQGETRLRSTRSRRASAPRIDCRGTLPAAPRHATARRHASSRRTPNITSTLCESPRGSRRAPREPELLLAIAPDRRRRRIERLVVHAGSGAVVKPPRSNVRGVERLHVDHLRRAARTVQRLQRRRQRPGLPFPDTLAVHEHRRARRRSPARAPASRTEGRNAFAIISHRSAPTPVRSRPRSPLTPPTASREPDGPGARRR